MRTNLIVSSVFALAGLGVLVGLGNWQLQRLAWKQGLLAQIEARVGAVPVPLGVAAGWFDAARDAEYMRVRVTGRYHHAGERHVYALEKGRAGWHIYTPLALDDGRTIFINRGFVPLTRKQQDTRRDGLIAGPVTVTGLVRQPPEKAGLFAPDSRLGKNEFFWRDMANMAASAGDVMAKRRVGFFLDAQIEEAAAGRRAAAALPRIGTTRLSLPNRHLEYALTWYGLALALVGVYAFFVRSWRQERRSNTA